jgi:Sec-independent protein translocase protein TatA
MQCCIVDMSLVGIYFSILFPRRVLVLAPRPSRSFSYVPGLTVKVCVDARRGDSRNLRSGDFCVVDVMKRFFLPLFIFLLWASRSALAFAPRSHCIRQCIFQPSIQGIHGGHAVSPPASSPNVAWRRLQLSYHLPKQGLGRTHQTRLMGVFGLGFGEIAIIVVIAAFVLGPEKIGAILRSSGETANEFKEELSKVPDEFKKGLEEGEVEARSRKAKKIKVVSRSNASSEEKKED